MNSISRRSFLALASTLIVTASIPQVSFASSKGMRSKEQADDIIVYSDDLFTVIQRDQTFIIKDRFGCSMSCAFNNQNSSILVTFPDNSTHTLSQDENGCVLIDGTLATDLLYVHEQGLPLPKGCVLMSTQKMTFEVLPQKDRENQLYVAFRISDTAGLLPPDNISGKPVVLEVIPQQVAPSVSEDSKISKKARDNSYVTYRIPSICTVKLSDGMNVIFQSRVPVYQLGTESTFPLNMDMD